MPRGAGRAPRRRGDAAGVDAALSRAIKIGNDLDQAVQFVMALGPAGELIRLAGSQAVGHRSSIVAALQAALAELQEPDGTVRAPASTWIIGARSPGA
jgi:hypothetical protein